MFSIMLYNRCIILIQNRNTNSMITALQEYVLKIGSALIGLNINRHFTSSS